MTTTHQLRAEIDIDAPPDAVWAVLADVDAHAAWNPFVRRLSGELREGAKLEAQIAPPGGRSMTFKPTVLTAEPGRELRWLGSFLLPGLLDGEHSFELEPLAGNRTRFVQSERFSGLLLALVKKSLDKTQAGFEEMNRALKHEVEARGAGKS